MLITEVSLRFAIKNISAFGDTDVFPFPLEKHWFGEQPDVVLTLLRKMGNDFDATLQHLPLFSSTELVNVSHFGFRAATQLEPLWNALFLAATIQLAHTIEKQRLPTDQVFSYRFEPNEQKVGFFQKSAGETFT